MLIDPVGKLVAVTGARFESCAHTGSKSNFTFVSNERRMALPSM